MLIDDLRALRDQLDRVLGDLERLAPVLAAWHALHPSVSAAPNRGSAKGRVIASRPASEPAPERSCPECSRTFQPNTPRQKYCSSQCRNTANDRRYNAERKEGKRPPRGQVRGPGKPGRAPAEGDLADLEPLAWPKREGTFSRGDRDHSPDLVALRVAEP